VRALPSSARRGRAVCHSDGTVRRARRWRGGWHETGRRRGVDRRGQRQKCDLDRIAATAAAAVVVERRSTVAEDDGGGGGHRRRADGPPPCPLRGRYIIIIIIIIIVYLPLSARCYRTDRRLAYPQSRTGTVSRFSFSSPFRLRQADVLYDGAGRDNGLGVTAGGKEPRTHTAGGCMIELHSSWKKVMVELHSGKKQVYSGRTALGLKKSISIKIVHLKGLNVPNPSHLLQA